MNTSGDTEVAAHASGLSREVSVIVCVKDCEGLMRDCLTALRDNNPAEIIVVDGLSRDGTAKIAADAGAKVLSDNGRGLAYARLVGVLGAGKPNVLMIGPDNILPPNFVSEFLRLGRSSGLDVVGAQTRVLNPLTFSDRGLDYRWRLLMGAAGPRDMVGTPYLAMNEVLLETNYDERASVADDTDLFERLRAKGRTCGVVPLTVYDANGMSLQAAWKKFKWYGAADAFYYRKYAPGWTLKRKARSWTHPLRQTANYVARAVQDGEFQAAAWLLLMMAARYVGWLETARRIRGRPDAV